LFLTALVLIVLTQVVVLHWSLEAIFFVAWFLLALSVQHDSRLSAAMGLVFLAACPFLLIAKKDPVAEQAANYAYFFLAIGVLVQLEEMVLERFGWLNRKLDFSYLWLPVGHAFHRGWNSGVAAIDQLTQQAYQKLGRVPPVAPSKSSAWLFRCGVALVVLSLLVIVMIGMSSLLNANQLSHMQVSYDFIDHLDMAAHPIPPGEGEVINMQNWTIGQETHRVLYQSPAYAGSSRILYQVAVPRQSKLVFDVAMDPSSWELEGDGVAYTVYIVADGITHQVYTTYIDPKHNNADQRWYPNVIDLNKYSGKIVTFIFETNTGPMGDFRNDWSGWGEPRLLQP
jgi:hypothetical protein